MARQADLSELERERMRLYADLAGVGDFRPGSLSAVMRRCGKLSCACAAPAHPGHGPQHILTKKVAGRTVSLHLRPGPELEKAASEVASYRRFKAIVGELVEVNEAICDARAVSPLADQRAAPPEAEKGGSSASSRRRSRRR
jgi:hypothetical protein